MDKLFSLYLRFKPSEHPERNLISSVACHPFAYIFTPTASQDEVYMKFRHISDDLLAGRNACLILVGKNGSGKRYSLFGRFPTDNGIVPRITEELLQEDTEKAFKLLFSATDALGQSLISPKKTSDEQLLLRFESNLLELSRELASRDVPDPVAFYKLVWRRQQTGAESALTIIQLTDTDANLAALAHLLKHPASGAGRIAQVLKGIKDLSKVSVLFTCNEDKKEVDTLMSVFHAGNTRENSEENSEEGGEIRGRVRELEKQLKETEGKLVEAEKKAHEYYEHYHKALLLINKETAQNVFLNSQNESLIRQISKETNILQSLEAKFQALIETCTKSHESTHLEFDSCVDSLPRSEASVELNVTDTLNLGISQVKVPLNPDPQTYAPYCNEIRDALEGNSELNKEVQLLQLKNQLIEASVINANLSRMLCSFEWKCAMVKHRYEMKRLLCKQQQERIKSLEEILEHLHTSFEALKNSKTGRDEKVTDKLFEKHCYKAIVDAQTLNCENKRSIKSMESRIAEAFKRESQKWMDLLGEHKENYEMELRRKQMEIIRLNELLGKWINKYMELQENVAEGKQPLGIVHYNQMQEIIYQTISAPAVRSVEKQLTPKARNQNHMQKFGVITGDTNPPI
jgi:hypothetical protein